MLSLDRLVKFRLLCLQRVHGLSSARVKNALRDRLDEVGELGLHVRPSGFESLKDLISVPVGLLVVVGEIHRERGQQLGLSEEGLDDLHNAQLDRILADGLRRALLLALVQAVVIPVRPARLRRARDAFHRPAAREAVSSPSQPVVGSIFALGCEFSLGLCPTPLVDREPPLDLLENLVVH